jgi:hypothetical protein
LCFGIRLPFIRPTPRAQEDAVGGGCTVLILVAPEVDAIAACRLLTYLLRVDNIQYKIKLVRL